MFKIHTNPIVKNELYRCLELYVLTSILYILITSCICDSDKITYNALYIIFSTLLNGLYVFVLYFYQINVKKRTGIYLVQFILVFCIVFTLTLILKFNYNWIQNNINIAQLIATFIYDLTCILFSTICYINLKKFSYYPNIDSDHYDTNNNDDSNTIYGEI